MKRCQYVSFIKIVKKVGKNRKNIYNIYMRKIINASICFLVCVMAIVFAGCNPFAGDEEYRTQDATINNSIEHMKAVNECLDNKISLEDENKEYYELISQILNDNNEGLSTFYFVNLTININDGLIDIDEVKKEDGSYTIEGQDSDSVLEFSRSEFQYKILDRTEKGQERQTTVFDFNQDKNCYKCLLTKNGEAQVVFEHVSNGNEYFVQIYSYKTNQLLKLHYEYRVERLRWVRAEAINESGEPSFIFDNGVENFIEENSGVYINL